MSEKNEKELQLSNLREIINQYISKGNYIQAIPYMERYRDILKEDDDSSNNYISALNDLGGVYRNIGNFDKAFENFKLALSIVEKNSGKFSEQYATISINLACIYRFIKDYEKAEKIFRNALSIYEQDEEMQEILMDLEKPKSTREMIERKNGLSKEVVRKSVLYANASNNLGTLFQDLKKYKDAINFHNRSLELLKNTSNFEYVAITLNNLVNPFMQLGDFKEALKLVNSSLEIFETELSKEHPFYLTALNNQGAIYFYLLYHDKALEVFKEVEGRLKNTYGINSPQYKACLKNINECEKKLKLK